MSHLSLAGLWSLTDIEGGNACDMALPGDGVTALEQAALIPDPYWGRNEYDLRWISERDWVARRTVTLDDAAVALVIDGLDTVATVRWNGEVVLQAQNVHRTYRVDLTGIARTGDNTVEITFHSPVQAGKARHDALPFPVPWHAENNPIPYGNALRKVQCDFGWDWNIALAPFGVVTDIRLEPAKAPRVDAIRVWQDHSGDSVRVTARVDLANADGATVSASLCGQRHQSSVESGSAQFAFTIADPVLWWPNGLGDQVLHDLTVTVDDVHTVRRIGLRDITLVTKPDAAGASFKFRVNGKDVFAKGANWIPADALHGRIKADDTRALLQSAADAHMNMIRVWGGGRYEPDSFYAACDELGLMVWQDFMFACSLYPSTPDFLAEVRAEVTENVARIQHHASIALWCGDNELVGALGWFPESRDNRDRYLVNYDRLNRTIEEALHSADPSANWWPSSPSLGPMDFGDGWHDDGQGDMHMWSVWHEGKDFDHYREIAPRFCSEFGFQSYPSMQVIKTFADPKDWNVAAPVFESHQKNAGGNARIAETMFRYFRWPERFEDFVWLSQIQQGLAIKTAVTQWRGLKPHTMGTLIWQLNDTWPVCSWSSLDYGGQWKMLHHMVQKFYEPLTVVAMPTQDSIVLRAVNDSQGIQSVTVSASAINMAGTLRVLGTKTLTVGEDATEVLRLSADALEPDEILIFDWETTSGAKGRDHFAPRPYKAFDLPDPGLSLAHEANEITLTCTALALFVSLEADIPGRFSDNAFLMLPGTSKQITFTPDEPGTMPKFTVRDLYSATTAKR